MVYGTACIFTTVSISICAYWNFKMWTWYLLARQQSAYLFLSKGCYYPDIIGLPTRTTPNMKWGACIWMLVCLPSMTMELMTFLASQHFWLRVLSRLPPRLGLIANPYWQSIRVCYWGCYWNSIRRLCRLLLEWSSIGSFICAMSMFIIFEQRWPNENQAACFPDD